MDKRKQKKLKRAAAAYRKPPPPCPNCGEPGAHFMPPCFGDEGRFSCKTLEQRIVEHLEGSSTSTGDACNSFDVDEDVVLEAVIKGEIDQCNLCGYWCAHADMEIVDDEWICDGCLENNDAD